VLLLVLIMGHVAPALVTVLAVASRRGDRHLWFVLIMGHMAKALVSVFAATSRRCDRPHPLVVVVRYMLAVGAMASR
jgi:hypothetical protein